MVVLTAVQVLAMALAIHIVRVVQVVRVALEHVLVGVIAIVLMVVLPILGKINLEESLYYSDFSVYK